MKRILIVGAGSYVGESVKDYLEGYPDEYEVEVLDAKGLKPELEQFRDYDCVFYVAGIAHRKESKRNAHLYYEVNRDLAIAVAKESKAAGVSQFIIMSSMAVYGMTEGVIRKNTKPEPKTHYGRSKLEADRAIWKMRDEKFRVCILRPPMIYGKGCKGNYQRLRKLALTVPFFPKVDNQRSMLYIGNLNAFVKEVIDECRQGLFFPQNAEYVNTSEMVREIRAAYGKKMVLIPGFGWIRRIPIGVIKKVFGDLKYDKTGSIDTISEYDFARSIRETENG